jgi:SAM-dependent methyltransferase
VFFVSAQCDGPTARRIAIVDDLPERPVDPDWLDLREPADIRSRDGVAALIMDPLLRALGRSEGAGGAAGGGGAGRAATGGAARGARGLRVVDLGAGTGANLRWLAPRLSGGLLADAELADQRWTLVDHDPRLRAWGPAPSVTVRGDVADLARLLDDAGPVDLVTAAALLDLLDTAQVTAVADAVLARRVPALFSLNVTGEVALEPTDRLDGALAAAFDAHQRRQGRLGPDAGAVVAALFHGKQWTVVTAQTPWRLAAAVEAELVEAWLLGRVEAAVEWRPALQPDAEAWLERRRVQCRAGELTAMVGHVDILALPTGSPRCSF